MHCANSLKVNLKHLALYDEPWRTGLGQRTPAVLALASETGDTATFLSKAGGSTLVELDDAHSIFQVLPRFVAALKSGTHPLPESQKVKSFSRSSQARDLASILEAVVI